jgi:hypothetical protein
MFSNTGVPRVTKKLSSVQKKSSRKQWGTKYREGTPETQREMARRARDKTCVKVNELFHISASKIPPC